MSTCKPILATALALAFTLACGTTRPHENDTDFGGHTTQYATPGDGATPKVPQPGPNETDSRLSPKEQKGPAGQKDIGVDVPPGRGTAGSGNRPPGPANRP